jgi:hypothetical protein
VGRCDRRARPAHTVRSVGWDKGHLHPHVPHGPHSARAASVTACTGATGMGAHDPEGTDWTCSKAHGNPPDTMRGDPPTRGASHRADGTGGGARTGAPRGDTPARSGDAPAGGRCVRAAVRDTRVPTSLGSIRGYTLPAKYKPRHNFVYSSGEFCRPYRIGLTP